MTRGLRCLAVGLGLGAGLLAAPPERVTLQLKWRHQVQFAGYYAAQAQGYYPEAGELRLLRRLKVALFLILAILAFLTTVVLAFLWFNRRLSHAIRRQIELDTVLLESEQRFRFIAERATDVIWIMDIASERFTYISPSVFALRGYTPEEVQAQPAAAALTPASAVLVRQELEASLAEWASGGPVAPRVTEVEQPHRDGHLVCTEVVTTLHGDREGRPVSVLGITRDITERKRAEAKLRHELQSLEQLASTDLLTGTWNRRHFEEAVEGEMHRSNRYGQPLSLLLLDLDHFKRVNDTYGHPVGDQVLKQLADCVRGVIRLSDSLTRWGGEEFIVLMPNTGLASATILAERIREGIAAFAFEGAGTLTASLGLAEYLPSTTLAAWLERTDQAMYRAKSEGRNQVVADPMRSGLQAAQDPLEGTFLKLVWNDSYCSGNRLIDAQHRHLFHLANELFDSMLTGSPPDEISMFVAGLLSELVQHFCDEEAILAELGYPELQAHTQKHADLVAMAQQTGRDFRAGTLSVGHLFQFLAYDVVATHMLKEDRKFFHLTAD